MLKLEKKRGTITVDDEVIQNIVSSTAGNCFGIAGMEAKNATEQFSGNPVLLFRLFLPGNGRVFFP